MTTIDTAAGSTTGRARPGALFVCGHNAGRSQMAAGFLRELSGGAVEVRSAGSVPAAGQGIESVRSIRDEIRRRVLGLLDRLGVPAVLPRDAV